MLGDRHEALLSARDPPLHGRDRDHARLCHFGELHPFDVAQGEDDPIVGGHAIEHLVSGAHGLGELGPCLDSRSFRQLVAAEQREQAAPRTGAELGADAEHGDSSEPRLQRVRILEALDAVDGRDEHVLHEIAEIAARPDEAHEHTPHVLVIAVVESGSPGGLTRSQRGDDLRIRVEEREPHHRLARGVHVRLFESRRNSHGTGG